MALLCVAQQRGAADVQDPTAEYAAEIQKPEKSLNGRRFDEALDAFKQASALRKKTSAEAHLRIARAYHGLGDFKNAVSEEAAKHTGNDRALQARISNQRRRALFGLSKKPDDKHIREAESAFRSALSLDGRVVMAHYIAELQSFIASASTVPEAAEARRMIEDRRRAREAFAPDPTYVHLDHDGVVRGTRSGWSPTVDLWLDGQVKKYLKAMRSEAGR